MEKCCGYRFSRVLWAAFFCCLGGALALPGDAAAARSLKYCHDAQDSQPLGLAANHFAKLVKEKTNGSLEIQVFPANQLGNNRQLVESLKMGALDIGTMGLGALAYLDNRYLIMQLPYVFRDAAHIHKVLAGPLGGELREIMLKKSNVRILNQNWDRLTRHVCGSRPIKTLADLKGYKVRAGNRPAIVGFKALGASPLSVPLKEMYVSLQQGVSDGAELPSDYVAAYSMFEVAKYMNLTYHTYGTQFLAVSEHIWRTLTPAQQKALQEATAETEAFNNALTQNAEAEYQAALKKNGMIFVETDHRAFADEIRAKLPAMEKDIPGLTAYFERIQAVR